MIFKVSIFLLGTEATQAPISPYASPSNAKSKLTSSLVITINHASQQAIVKFYGRKPKHSGFEEVWLES
jgi:hypothetical protein